MISRMRRRKSQRRVAEAFAEDERKFLRMLKPHVRAVADLGGVVHLLRVITINPNSFNTLEIWTALSEDGPWSRARSWRSNCRVMAYLAVAKRRGWPVTGRIRRGDEQHPVDDDGMLR